MPAGKWLRHSCDRPLCCNPRHLKPGTAADNYADPGRTSTAVVREGSRLLVNESRESQEARFNAMLLEALVDINVLATTGHRCDIARSHWSLLAAATAVTNAGFLAIPLYRCGVLHDPFCWVSRDHFCWFPDDP